MGFFLKLIVVSDEDLMRDIREGRCFTLGIEGRKCLIFRTLLELGR